MKIKIQIALIGFALINIVSFGHTEPIESYSLTVNVEQLRNSEGVVQFFLYNKEGSIPDDKHENFYRSKMAEIDDGSSSIVFNNLPKGRYAINFFHDENGNGKIDKGFILPIEGVGFSNYQSFGLTNIPRFTKASFNLISNMKKSVSVIYF